MAAFREIKVVKVAEGAVATIGQNTPAKAVIFRVTRPLTETEHESVAKKLRSEEELAGVKVILVPYSCEVEGDGEKQVATGRGKTGAGRKVGAGRAE